MLPILVLDHDGIGCVGGSEFLESTTISYLGTTLQRIILSIFSVFDTVKIRLSIFSVFDTVEIRRYTSPVTELFLDFGIMGGLPTLVFVRIPRCDALPSPINSCCRLSSMLV